MYLGNGIQERVEFCQEGNERVCSRAWFARDMVSHRLVLAGKDPVSRVHRSVNKGRVRGTVRYLPIRPRKAGK